MPLPYPTSEKPSDTPSFSSSDPTDPNNISTEPTVDSRGTSSSSSSSTSTTSSSTTNPSSVAAEVSDDAGASRGGSAAQHTKSEVEEAADKLYEERMEEEYAKREGGA